MSDGQPGWCCGGVLVGAAVLGLLVASMCGTRIRRWLRDHDQSRASVDPRALPFGAPTHLPTALMMLAHAMSVDPLASPRYWRLRGERRASRTLVWLLWGGVALTASSLLGAFGILLVHPRDEPVVLFVLLVTAVALAVASGLYIQGWLLRHAPELMPDDPFARSLALVVAAVHVPAARHCMRLCAARGESRRAGWLFWVGFGPMAGELALVILWRLVSEAQAARHGWWPG